MCVLIVCPGGGLTSLLLCVVLEKCSVVQPWQFMGAIFRSSVLGSPICMNIFTTVVIELECMFYFSGARSTCHRPVFSLSRVLLAGILDRVLCVWNGLSASLVFYVASYGLIRALLQALMPVCRTCPVSVAVFLFLHIFNAFLTCESKNCWLWMWLLLQI